jgi:hypothetical protein
MKGFNKYQFIDDLESSAITEIENGNIQCESDLDEYLWDGIDDACIYYADCWAICAELSATDFTIYGSDIQNVTQLACIALSDYVYDELDRNKLLELINAKQNDNN